MHAWYMAVATRCWRVGVIYVYTTNRDIGSTNFTDANTHSDVQGTEESHSRRHVVCDVTQQLVTHAQCMAAPH